MLFITCRSDNNGDSTRSKRDESRVPLAAGAPAQPLALTAELPCIIASKREHAENATARRIWDPRPRASSVHAASRSAQACCIIDDAIVRYSELPTLHTAQSLP